MAACVIQFRKLSAEIEYYQVKDFIIVIATVTIIVCILKV